MSSPAARIEPIGAAPTEGQTAPAPGGTTRRPVDRAGWLAAIALALACFTLAALRIRNHWAAALDQSIFDQGLWLMAHGRAPHLTIIDDNLFGDHFSPVLVLFVPLYRLVATPYWLVAAQALAIGWTVVPMRRLARDLGADPRIATVLVLASAPLLAAATYDFHPVVLAVPVMAYALVAALQDDVPGCTVAVVLTACIRADAAFVLLGIAVLARPAARRRLLVLSPIPLAIGAVVPTLLGSKQSFTRYWGHLGSGPLDAVLHPWRIAPAMASTHTLEMLLIWLLPVGFLVVARPRWLAALLVGSLPMLLSDSPSMAMPWFHHAAVLVPICVGGALDALRPGRSKVELRLGMVAAGAVAALLVASPLSPYAPASLRLSTFSSPRSAPGLDVGLSRIGPDEAVSAKSWILALLAHRQHAYQYPCPDLRIGAIRCAAPNRKPAADVVFTTISDAQALRASGWVVDVLPGGELVLARRP